MDSVHNPAPNHTLHPPLSAPASSVFAGKGSNLNLSFVRTVRVLKVLKSVQRVEGMRTLVASLLKCAPLLLQVRRPALARCRVDLA